MISGFVICMSGWGLYLLHRNRRDAYAWGIVGVSWLILNRYVENRLTPKLRAALSKPRP